MGRPLVLLAVLLLAACGVESGGATADAGPAEVALPAACEAEISEFLVAVEPIVADVDWDAASAEDLEAVANEMSAPSEGFDPDVCPDLPVSDARQAWLRIADRDAPDTRGYVEFTYPEE